MTPLLAQAAGGTANTAEVILFAVFGVIALGAAIAVITMRNIVHGALMLVINLLAISGLYLALQSSFLSIVQVIVYAGAIMVLFLFVIMLLGVDRDDLMIDVRRSHQVGAIALAALLAGGLLWGFAGSYTSAASRCGDQAPADTSGDVERCVGLDQALAANEEGAVGVLADRLFTRYTFPLEASALLLTVATIGAMVLGRRNEPEMEDDPAFEPSAPVPTADDVEAALVGAESESLADDGADDEGEDA